MCYTHNTLIYRALVDKNIYLSENANNIICFFIRYWTAYLRTQHLECTTADTQLARKLLPNLCTRSLTYKDSLMLDTTLQITGEMKH